MKKLILQFIVVALVATPLLVQSAPSLAERLKGKILLAVEDKGKTYFVHEDGGRYRVTTETAQKIFEKLALGISNNDLEQIPLKDVGIDPESQSTETKNYFSNSSSGELSECKNLLTVKDMLIKDYESTTNDLMGQANELLDLVNNQMLETEKWKKIANEQTSTRYDPTYVPITKCFYSGSTVTCYDVSLFPKELNNILDALDDNPYISLTTREGRKLQAIQDYYKN